MELKSLIASNYQRVITERKEWSQEILSMLRSGACEVYIWGIGNVGQLFYKYIKGYGAKISGFVDSDSEKQGTTIDGIMIISPEDLSLKINPTVIIGTAMYSCEIWEKLNAMGIHRILDAMDLMVNSMADNLKENDANIASEKIGTTFNLLEDAESREVFRRHIEGFFSFSKGFNKPSYFHDLCRPNQYFPDDIMFFSSDDVCVDCGAYIGDTLSNFVKFRKPFEHYICYELSKKNFFELQRQINIMTKETVEGTISLYNFGVSDKDQTIRYKDDDSSTTCSQDGIVGHLVCMDDHLKNKRVSFIKMDIEGMEMSALRGANKIIRVNKPKLAICVYHKVSDFWDIPLYIHSLNPRYKMYMRQHTPHWPETVCYAIP